MTPGNQNLFKAGQDWKGSLLECWHAFLIRYPLDCDCLEELCRFSNEIGTFSCSECGESNKAIVAGARFVICTYCRHKDWRTAGTVFEGIRRPRAWLGAVWLLNHGVAFNAGDLQRLAGVSRDCAANIIRKLSMVLQRSLDSEQASEGLPQESQMVVESASLLGVVGKRSRITPAYMHPRAEEEILEKELARAADECGQSKGIGRESSVELEMDVANDPSLTRDDRYLYSLLTNEFRSFDSLFNEFGDDIGNFNLALMNLQLAGWLEQSFGSAFRRRVRRRLDLVAQGKGTRRNDGSVESLDSEGSKSYVTGATLKSLIYFLRRTYHALSRKFLQVYVAIFVFLNRQWRGAMPDLLELCRNSRPIRREEIRAFVTPLSFHLPTFTIS